MTNSADFISIEMSPNSLKGNFSRVVFLLKMKVIIHVKRSHLFDFLNKNKATKVINPFNMSNSYPKLYPQNFLLIKFSV